MPNPRRFAPMLGWPASLERVAGFAWNPRPASRGMGGQLPRNTHPGETLPTLEQHEAAYIHRVLEKTGGNRTQAAEILGIDRVSLWRKLKRYAGNADTT